jgi:hypothetical protein
MASLQPLTIGNSLVAKIQALYDRKAEATEWELRSLSSEAEKLAKVSPVEASIVKAGIAVLKWDHEQVCYWASNAVRLDPNIETKLNASMLLRLIGDTLGAADYAEQAISLAPNNVEKIVLGADAFIFDGRLQSCLSILRSLPAGIDVVERAIGEIQSHVISIQKSGVTEQQVQAQLRIATRLATSRKVRILGLQMFGSTDPLDGIHSFVIEVVFLGSLQEELELEDALAEELSKIENWEPSRLSIEFKYQKEDELHTEGSVYAG